MKFLKRLIVLLVEYKEKIDLIFIKYLLMPILENVDT